MDDRRASRSVRFETLHHFIGLLSDVGELVLIVILIQIAYHFQLLMDWTSTAK